MNCPKCKGLVTEEFDIMTAGYLLRCMNCGWRGEPAPPDLTMNRTTAERQREVRPRATPTPSTERVRVYEWRERRFQEGICRTCPKPRLEDGVFCRRCRAANRARVKAHYRRKKRLAA